MRSLYEILGVERDASITEIEKAGRERLHETHPDKAGIERRAEFDEAKRAYDTLRDPEARAAYDRGEGVAINEAESRAIALVSGAVEAILNNDHPALEGADPIEVISQALGMSKDETLVKADKERRKLAKVENYLRRVKLKKAGDQDVLGAVLRAKRRKATSELHKFETLAADIELAIQIVNRHDFSRPSALEFFRRAHDLQASEAKPQQGAPG